MRTAGTAGRHEGAQAQLAGLLPPAGALLAPTVPHSLQAPPVQGGDLTCARRRTSAHSTLSRAGLWATAVSPWAATSPSPKVRLEHVSRGRSSTEPAVAACTACHWAAAAPCAALQARQQGAAGSQNRMSSMSYELSV
ncbi:hypothetical protein ABPG75_003361 [Micractinium tetrahymenae]